MFRVGSTPVPETNHAQERRMKNPLVSVIVPTYNRHEMLRNALRDLTLQETGEQFLYEIVVIDNRSTDATRAVVEEVAANSLVPVIYVREETQVFAQALNSGVREARGNWLAFCDDDVLAEPNWLRELLSAAFVMKAKVVGGTRRLQLNLQGMAPLGSTSRSLLGEQVYGGVARVCQGERMPSGGHLLVAREVFNSIGLFDTSMVMSGEDFDFVRRARASGIIVAICPTATVHHVIPPYRVTPSYFWWTSMRLGWQLAYVDNKVFGRARMLFSFVARMGQAILVNFPLLIFSVLTGNRARSLDRRCLLWRAVGYARATASLAAPSLFKQATFFSQLEFRRERTTFSQSQAT
jgi:glycosyltransferase involved in cell wall biosynthesis